MKITLLLSLHVQFQRLIKDHSRLLAKAHPACYELVEKVINQVDNTLSIGLNRLNWLSKNLDELFLPAEEKLHLMSNFLDQISSLIIHRIEEPIHELSRFEILEFPDEPIDFQPFVHEIRQQMIVKADKLNSLSMQIESTVLHVIKMFFDQLGYQSKPFEQKLGDLGKPIDDQCDENIPSARSDAIITDSTIGHSDVRAKCIERKTIDIADDFQ